MTAMMRSIRWLQMVVVDVIETTLCQSQLSGQQCAE
jgi:hypothetical protein